jgi:hypothetical protein
VHQLPGLDLRKVWIPWLPAVVATPLIVFCHLHLYHMDVWTRIGGKCPGKTGAASCWGLDTGTGSEWTLGIEVGLISATGAEGKE